MHLDTLFLAVRVLDRYLSTTSVPLKEFQLLGIACLFVAAKYEEIYPPPTRCYTKLCQHAYSEQKLMAMQSHVLLQLGFELAYDPPPRFLAAFCRQLKSSF